MVKSIVYVEGGGDRKALRTECRRGFSEFFGRVGLKGRMPKVSACGGRQQAYNDFCHALDKPRNDRFVVLLVDSEGPVAEGSGPWTHLKNRDNWDRPPGAADDNVHLMVQCMEAWFLADKDTLAQFFGNGFSVNTLPKRTDVENIPKDDVLASLMNATRQCVPKGEYGKGQHSFKILAQIDPDNVRAASPYAKRLVDTVLANVS